MKSFLKQWKTVLFAFCYVLLGTTPVWADDTEIYFGSNTSGVKNNILFVIDTSGSMAGTDSDSVSRIDELKAAFKTLLTGLDNVNVGLMRFSNPGGPILYPVTDINKDLSAVSLGSGSINKPVAFMNDDGYDFNTHSNIQLGTPQLELGALADYSNLFAGSVPVTIAANADDAETRIDAACTTGCTNTGRTTLSIPSLNATGTQQQVVGIRFAGVAIPAGATITSAYLEFIVNSTGGTFPMNAQIWGEQVSGGVFATTSPNTPSARYAVSTNLTTTSPVVWTMTAAPGVGSTAQTPELATIVQQIVGNAGWASGNAMTFFFKRPASSVALGFVSLRSRDNAGTPRPKLIVNYTTGSAYTGSVTTAVRFTNVNVPRGATVNSAHLEFVAGTALSGTAQLGITAELTGNSAALVATPGNINSRTTSSTQIDWTITDPWVSGDTYSSPELKTLVQEIVNQPGASGWCGGNTVTFLLKGLAGRRLALALESGSDVAPKLVLDYDVASVPTDGSSCRQSSFVRQINGANDDGEENKTTHDVNLIRTSLDMSSRSGTGLTVGLRFNNIRIPKSAKIQSAYLVFHSAENDATALSLSIYGEDTGNSAAFVSLANNLSSRMTVGPVSWPSVSSWVNGGTYNAPDNTPDISSIIQTIVNRSDWASGNSLSLVIDGASTANRRRATSYNGNTGDAPKLIVNYADDGSSSGIYTVREKLLEIVDSLSPSGNTPLQDTFYEAVQYFRGQAVDYGKVRGAGPYSYTRVSHPDSLVPSSYTSITPAGCTDSSSAACAAETINGAAVYKSPITYACQANHIVLLTDGQPNSDHSTAKIHALPDFPTAACSYAGGGECMPELGTWVSTTADMSSTGAGSQNLSGVQNVIVDTIAFYQDAGGNAFLQAISDNAGGRNDLATSSAELLAALEAVSKPPLSENTSFVAAGAAVNAFNRTLSRDDLYFSVFKPERTPKWAGNLKKYKLAFDSSGNPEVQGVGGVAAVDPVSGFFADGSQSFWSAAADGPNVKKGGAGALITDYRTRNLYTNVGTSTTLSDDENALVSTNALLTKALFGATAYTPAEFTDLVDWARGKNVKNDVDPTGTDTRFVFADPLHSRPVAITYYGPETAPDITVFVASNGGALHAIDDKTGEELFAFVPTDLLPLQKTLYENVADTGHPSGLDGSITTWVIDPDGDGLVLKSDGSPQSGNRVILIVGMRRGGKNYYALDVTDRSHPKLLWTIRGGDTGFGSLGETWSQPEKARIQLDTDTSPRRVLIFGGGYDPQQDTVTTRTTDSQGNSIYIVDLLTGALVWNGGSSASYTTNFADMHYGIPAQVASADVTGDGLADFFFVGDMGGQVWRFDIHNGQAATNLITGGVIADLGVASGSNIAANNRRFYHTPTLFAGSSGGVAYLGVGIGSGWRAHPLSVDTTDRFYVVKQSSIFSAPATYTKIRESDLYDATDNTIGEGSVTDQAGAKTTLATKSGWFLTLPNSGEKVLSTPLVINGVVSFDTYEPNAQLAVDPCTPQTGTNRSYSVFAKDATPAHDPNADGFKKDDRSLVLNVPGIVDGPKLVCTDKGCAQNEGTKTTKANVGDDKNFKRIYWYENPQR